jgi:hypothetical protein
MPKTSMLPDEVIYRKIYYIRGQKVMLDSDLAELYGVETKRLNEQVRRNSERFPKDFMFQLTEREWNNLKSQFATSSVETLENWGGRRTLPCVFTEHGVLMLSSVLNSKQAIAVNIQIMRVYIRIKELFQTDKELILNMEEIERRMDDQDERMLRVFEHIQQLMEAQGMIVREGEEPRPRVGYRTSADQS